MIFVAMVLILLVQISEAQSVKIDRHVISSGGGESHSAIGQIEATIGQPGVGNSSSSRFVLGGGFWADFKAENPGCVYISGDINGNGQTNGIDVVFGVNYFKTNNPPPIDCHPVCPNEPDPFYAAGDVNGNCAFNGIDITYFVRYLKGQIPNLLYCADCPPGSLNLAKAPTTPISRSESKASTGKKESY